ncbi:MAG: ferrous iron transport protein A [Clostridiales bacterium]|jgi:Fe2+ transport system protein FeoA|nr:ferrous iron transport protein A [Clostridiales bacterium]
MKLHQLHPGQSGEVLAIDLPPATKQQILDMGVTPGVQVRLKQKAPLGDPLWIEIRGYDLILRKSIAAQIAVKV